MNWFQGNIAEAVAYSKARNAIFVIYIEGKDENSEKLTTFLNEEKVWKKLGTEDFVAIKISSDSNEYTQFASIYTMVPVPSIFFIGQTGHPLEVGTSIMKSAEELENKIDRALAAANRSTSNLFSSPSTSQMGSQIASSQEAVQSEAGGLHPPDDLKPAAEKIVTPQTAAATGGMVEDELPSSSTVGDPSANIAPDAPNDGEEEKESDINQRLEQTRKMLEQRRRERAEKERIDEKEQELRRRREGKDLQSMQQWQREQELKELRDNLRRERQEESAARERIRAQIAADRVERAQKFSGPGEQPAATPTLPVSQATPAASPAPGMTRLQFRFPNGLSKSHIFESQQTLDAVRQYVKNELLPGTGIRDFILATTFPKREFTANDDASTLVELSLHPSALILVIARDGSGPSAILSRSGGSLVGMLGSIVLALLTPVFAAVNFFKGVIGGRRDMNISDENTGANAGPSKRANEDPQGPQNEAAKRRNLDRFLGGASTSKEALPQPPPNDEANDSRPYRPYAGTNIHRLADTHRDSDDENATWNGNSTQQQ